MKRSLKLLLLVLFTPVFLGSVLAKPSQAKDPETWDYTGEVFGTVGWGKFMHGDSPLGDGFLLDTGFGIRPFKETFRGLGFEFHYSHLDFDYNPVTEISKTGTFDAFTGNVLYHFGSSKTQPFVGFGMGVLAADYRERILSEILDAGGNIVQSEWRSSEVRASHFAIRFSAGIKIALIEHFSLRPEVLFLDTTPGKGFNWGGLGATVGAAYHW
jgi:hypothetical protein